MNPARDHAEPYPIICSLKGLVSHEDTEMHENELGTVIEESKSVENIHPAHKKQLLTYLRLGGMKPGYLLNSGEALMKDGITRTVNGEL